MKTTIVDVQRMPIEGFRYEDCVPFEGDAVRHTVRWGNARANDLEGRLVRLEFAFRHADLYAFLAAGASDTE